MTWNYTKTWACLSVVAIGMGFVLKPMAGQVLAVIVIAPFCIGADIVSWWRTRRVTVLPPDR